MTLATVSGFVNDSGMKFSANLGFLFTDRALPQAIEAAYQAGFDAVECHWPYATDPEEVRRALASTGLTMRGLNTERGATNGLSALPDEGAADRAFIQALNYAVEIECAAIHCMSGQTQPDSSAADRLVGRLQRWADQTDKTLLIEPLNPKDAPDYFLNSVHQAADLLSRVNRVNVKLMFDVYHIQRIHGDVTQNLRDYLPLIGHIQFAGAPNRGDPLDSELDIHYVLRAAETAGYDGFFGAEYRGDDLTWLDRWRA